MQLHIGLQTPYATLRLLGGGPYVAHPYIPCIYLGRRFIASIHQQNRVPFKGSLPVSLEQSGTQQTTPERSEYSKRRHLPTTILPIADIETSALYIYALWPLEDKVVFRLQVLEFNVWQVRYRGLIDHINTRTQHKVHTRSHVL